MSDELDAATIDVEARSCGSNRTPDASVHVPVSWCLPYLPSRAIHRVDASVLCILPALRVCVLIRDTLASSRPSPYPPHPNPRTSPHQSRPRSILSILSLRIYRVEHPHRPRPQRAFPRSELSSAVVSTTHALRSLVLPPSPSPADRTVRRIVFVPAGGVFATVRRRGTRASPPATHLRICGLAGGGTRVIWDATRARRAAPIRFPSPLCHWDAGDGGLVCRGYNKSPKNNTIFSPPRGTGSWSGSRS
ncbi:hypothetical protein B0H17DRAFT_1211951 [Mycena rosella]|uniref:Uncharacterized protein n=1 Tax=Mycena rosella TaxID=1033263 RepID=A0AAD7CTF1_MYCRO|nr:hypothetical protein B0H17DRAFT_1211951 [Mycena rosella]